MLKRSLQIIVLLAGICSLRLPADAATRYVSKTGSINVTCDFSSPCSSMDLAVTAAGINDTVVCLDTFSSSSINSAGSITITKSIDINCSAAGHVLRDSSAGQGAQPSISINIPVSANDPLRTVRLRGISIFGATAPSRYTTRGIDIVDAAAVYVEGMVISDNAQSGIHDRRTGGQTKLFITDTVVRNNGGVGILVAAQAPNTTAIDNVRSENNLYGVAAGNGNRVLIRNSIFSGNSSVGVEGDSGAQIVLDNSSVSHNNIGIQSSSSVRLSNNNIAFNNTAIAGASGTFGNNRFSANTSVGTGSTPLGGATSDYGQQ